jgi:hypothetical protein
MKTLVTKNMMNAEQLIEFVAPIVKSIFKRTEQFIPLVHFIRADGSHSFFALPVCLTEKEQWATYTRGVLNAEQAVTCVFINEAWSLRIHTAGMSREQIDECRKRIEENTEGLENVPGRQEIVMFVAEDVNGAITAEMPIIRPESGKPCLGDLEIIPREGAREGRFVGLLPQQKANA